MTFGMQKNGNTIFVCGCFLNKVIYNKVVSKEWCKDSRCVIVMLFAKKIKSEKKKPGSTLTGLYNQRRRIEA